MVAMAMGYLQSLEIELLIMFFCKPFSNQFSEQIIYKKIMLQGCNIASNFKYGLDRFEY